MPLNGVFKRIIAANITLVAVLGMVLASQHAIAQQSQPQFMMTWQANNSYVPPSYTGKALPNQASQITASLALISANGTPINIKNKTIYWYLNDTQIGGGVGAQTITFTPFGKAPNFMSLKAELPNYNGSLLIHSVQIPLIQPKAAIEVQHVSGQFSANPLNLAGTPYYFGVTNPSQLSYSWSVNGQSPATNENPQTLQINLDPSTPSGSSLAVSLNITDAVNTMTGTDSTNLTYIK